MKKVLFGLALLMAMGTSASADIVCYQACKSACQSDGGTPTHCNYQCGKECGDY